MPYLDLTLPTNPTRPFFYTSFVQTADGKAYIDKHGYWPIGSRTDYETFTSLRARADVIIDGKNTAIRFGKPTIYTLHNDNFLNLRKSHGKTNPIEYVVLTTHPDEALQTALQNLYGYTPTIFKDAIPALVTYLQQKGAKHVFVDGGPHVIASFLREKLLDEMFITIAPRIFGNKDNMAITMVEGLLLEPHEVSLEIMSMENVANEAYIHYKVVYKS